MVLQRHLSLINETLVVIVMGQDLRMVNLRHAHIVAEQEELKKLSQTEIR